MFDEQRLGNDGTEASGPCKPDDGDNQMKEKDEDIAHPGMVSKPEKRLILAQFSNSPWTPTSLECCTDARYSPRTSSQKSLSNKNVFCFIFTFWDGPLEQLE